MEIRAKLEAQGYVDGKFVKKERWIRFPLNDKELMDEVIRCVEDTDDVKLPVFAKRMVRVTEWDFPARCNFEDKFGEDGFAFDLDKVNELAENLRGLSRSDAEILEALLEDDYEFEEALDIVKNEDYRDFRNDSEEDIVRSFAEEECSNIPDYIIDNVCFDDAFEDLKRDCEYNGGKFIETCDGYIYIEH